MFLLLTIVLLIIFLPLALVLVLTGGLGLFAILTMIPTGIWVVVGGIIITSFAWVIVSAVREADAEAKAREVVYRFRFPGQVGGLIMPPSG